MTKLKLLLSLPVAVLLVWVVSLQVEVASGTRVVLPVGGYDPRDILAGHYLAIAVDYSGFTSECGEEFGKESWKKKDAFFCLEENAIVLNKPAECSVFIKGYCRYGRFNDNVSRFYIPEKMSHSLEKAVRDRENNPQLRLSVSKNGRAVPLELILDGKPFKEWLKQHK